MSKIAQYALNNTESIPGFSSYVNDVDKGHDVGLFSNHEIDFDHTLINGQAALTTTFWVKFDNVTTTQHVLSHQKYYIWMHSSGRLYIYCYISGTFRYTYFDSNINDSTWYHIAIAWSSGTGISVYKDGVHVRTSAAYSGTIDTYTDAKIGKQWQGSNPLTGRLFDFQMWDEKLSLAAINDIMNNPPGIPDPDPTYTYEIFYDEDANVTQMLNRGLTSEYTVTGFEALLLECTDNVADLVECNGCANTPDPGTEIPPPERT